MANEKRLIDANAIHDFVSEEFKDDVPYEWAWALTVVDCAPAVDAVPVVRCRDCKHLNVLNRKELYAHCPKTNTVFLPFELDTREHFCSLGERKEGAD